MHLESKLFQFLFSLQVFGLGWIHTHQNLTISNIREGQRSDVSVEDTSRLTSPART